MEETSSVVLVTGSTGFVGGRLVERLLAETDWQVRGLVRTPEKGRRQARLGGQIVAGDLTDAASVQAAMAGCQIVYHCAAWVGESGDPNQAWAVNVAGTRNVVDAAVAAGVRRFVHLSSCAVYGSLQAFEIDETTPRRPKGNLYYDSKLAAEEVVFDAYRNRGLPVVVPRPSQVYGPGSKQFTIRPVEAIRARKMILIDGGRHLCKPIYIDNLVDALILCATVEAAVGEAINLTDGYTVPWRDFFGAYGHMLGVDRFPSVPYPLAWLVGLYNEIAAALTGRKTSLNRATVNSLRSRNSFSNCKARQLLGWEPRVGFEEGMRRTEAWLKAESYLR
jgi:nucleoside-diphosphate-sugar epimerase